MPFPMKRVSELRNRSKGNYQQSLLWNLSINAKYCGDRGQKVKKKYKDVDGKVKSQVFYYEDVIFLGELDRLPYIFYTKNLKDQRSRFMSAFTFPDIEEECPVITYLNRFPKGKRKQVDGCMYSPVLEEFCAPVLAIDRQDGYLSPDMNHIIQPVYWFCMESTNYNPTCELNWKNLKDANDKYPVDEYVYRIYMSSREGEKRIFLFQPKINKKTERPIKITPKLIDKLVTTDHPWVDDWIDDDGNFCWDEEYYNDIHACAYARYGKFIDPKTEDEFNYNGYMDEAMEIFKGYLEDDSFPRPNERVVDSDSEEDEEHDN